MSQINTHTLLTKSQTLLWLGQEMNPDSPMYNMVMTYEIKGAISLSHFTSSFQKLVALSDALRSVFINVEGEIVQKYVSEINDTITHLDLSQETNPKEAYAIWENQRVRIPFALDTCLFDCALIKLSDTHFIWYLNQHHLITDGWSTSIIFNKMSNLYAEALANNLENTVEMPLFKSYATAYKSEIASKETEKAKMHWVEKITNLPDAPALYFKNKTTLNTASKRLLVELGKERSLKIKALANQKGIRGWTLDATLYNIFLTTLFSFLHRITGKEHLTIGSPTHNRTSRKAKNTIGLFIETFPLEITVAANETFLSLFKKVNIESNNFLKNAKAGSSTSELIRNFNVFFNYINSANSNFNGIPVTTSWVHPGHTDPRHKIRLHVHDFDNTGEIKLYFDLNTNFFSVEEQALVSQHFLTILDGFIENHEQEITKPSLITKTELDKITTWNNTEVVFDEDETLLTKFEAQAFKTPNKTALFFDNEKLSYKELNEKSNQVARFLIKNGIKKNDIITISLERSLEMMIYIYGVLKSGAVYLPVAANIPIKRLAYILENANSTKILYNNNLKIQELKNVTCYHTNLIQKEVFNLENTSNHIKINTNDLAYVIYTSGSTGKPKGVQCHHSGICNSLNWANTIYPLSEKDVLLQKTPITFDVSLWELFWPLQTGASLVIEKPNAHKNPEQLIKTIQKHHVTRVSFVPSMLSAFIQSAQVEKCKSLKKIFSSGEVLPLKLAKETLEKLDVQLYNLYGPTEAFVDVTSYLFNKTEIESIPIGKPGANTKLYILDTKNNLAPIGLPGELHIAGKQVAKGYLNRPNLTKEQFVKDIFSTNINAKMYKTGDLVKYKSDGNIEYLGRIDHQIKLRGQRIELNEIEKTLEKNKSINKAIVAVDAKDNLVAFYTGAAINEAEINANLRNNLPEYMIPKQFLHKESFETSASGKIDRKKLVQHFIPKNIDNEAIKQAPENEIEELIHTIWLQVIGIENIGIYENFIRIGGNSLMAIAITSRIKEALELEVSINDIFNYPTIKYYASYIEDTITQILNEQ